MNEKGKLRGRPPKDKKMKFIRTCISLPPEQHKFIREKKLILSWIVQDTISKLMKNEINRSKQKKKLNWQMEREENERNSTKSS